MSHPPRWVRGTPHDPALGTVAHRQNGNGRGPPHRRAHRFLFYCNEMVGLGHLRRTLAIIASLTREHADVTSLVITGCPVEPLFRIPGRTDTVKLPVRSRDANGRARSRLAVE